MFESTSESGGGGKEKTKGERGHPVMKTEVNEGGVMC